MKYSKGLKFGYGVFETIGYNGELMYFDDHMTRLNAALAFLDLPTVVPEHIKEKALEYLKNTDHNGIRISIYADEPCEITYETRHTLSKSSYKVMYSDIGRHSSDSLLRIKSSCHLSYALEKKEVMLKGIDEALHFNEKGFLTEGIYTNVFFVKAGVIHTPAVDCGLLPGIYRKKVIEVSKKLGIPYKIGYYYKEDIEQADEVFLTNALIGIMPVFELGKKTYNENNSMTSLLKKEML